MNMSMYMYIYVYTSHCSSHLKSSVEASILQERCAVVHDLESVLGWISDFGLKWTGLECTRPNCSYPAR